MRPARLAAPLAAVCTLLAACGSSSGTSSSSPSTVPGGTGTGTTASTSATSTCATGSISASGSTALQPLVQAAATAYMARCSGSTITVAGGGSSTGLGNVARGTSDIGDSDIPVSLAKSVDATSVKDHQVAVVIFAIIVNPRSGVTSMTTDQVQKVFSGQVTNWKDVGGSDVPVTLIERKSGSGTRLSFDKDVMGSASESTSPASTQDSTSLVVQGVRQADGGTSYATLGSVATSGLTVVKINGHDATVTEVNGGDYPFYAHEHMYTRGAGGALAQDFISFILSADFTPTVAAQKFVPNAQISGQSAVDRA